MGSRIVLNTPRFKGEFPFEIAEQPFTTLEWRWIKQISGYLPLTLDSGLEGGDPDIFLAFAVIALFRGGRVSESEALAVAKYLEALPADGASITMVLEEENQEDAESPPDVPAGEPATGQQLRSIGGSSKEISDLQASDLRRTGALA